MEPHILEGGMVVFSTGDSIMLETVPTSSSVGLYINTGSATTTSLGSEFYINTGSATTTSLGSEFYINTGSGLISTSSGSGYLDATSTSTTDSNGLIYVNFVDKKKILRNRIRQNLLIKSVSRSLERSFSLEEQKARNSLRDLITEKDWRRYVTNGFIMVKGTHYWYQIFNKGDIQVYHNGKRTHSICIHTDRSCPPTDHVLNMKLLVEIDERQIWRGGNVHTVGNIMSFSDLTVNHTGNLVELAKMLA